MLLVHVFSNDDYLMAVIKRYQLENIIHQELLPIHMMTCGLH